MKINLKKLDAARRKFEAEKGNLEQLIVDKVAFEFSIDHQASDGFVIVDESANNALLSDCISVINNKGSLSVEDFLKLCI